MDTPEPSINTEITTPATTSLGARLGNVFVAPTEVFDEVKASPPNHANWWVPLVLNIILGIIFTVVVFSQPAVIQGMKDAFEKQIQKNVDSGKTTQQTADKTIEMAESWMTPTFYRVFGILGQIFAQPIILFFAALIVWLIGRFALGGNFGYMKGVEAVGLASMIGAPGVIVRMLLAVIYGNMAMTLSPVLLVSHFNPQNRVHVLLSALDVFSIWYIVIMAIALARLSGSSFLKAAFWGFGIWGVCVALQVLLAGGK